MIKILKKFDNPRVIFTTSGKVKLIEWPEVADEKICDIACSFYPNCQCNFIQREINIATATANGVPPDNKEQFNRIFFPINGYAPGSYTCTCGGCKEDFFGDKRAVTCFQCAIKPNHPYNALVNYDVMLAEKKVSIARGNSYKIEGSADIRPADLIENGKKYGVYQVAVIKKKSKKEEEDSVQSRVELIRANFEMWSRDEMSDESFGLALNQNLLWIENFFKELR